MLSVLRHADNLSFPLPAFGPPGRPGHRHGFSGRVKVPHGAMHGMDICIGICESKLNMLCMNGLIVNK
jgi:hypothetical protein